MTPLLRVLLGLVTIGLGLFITVGGSLVDYSFRDSLYDCLDPLGLGLGTVFLGLCAIFPHPSHAP